ncbi:AAA family ATPase [Archangium violaceum]|uniref:AAA family ATPase n=1 Tax=Archangium violaceum TaxID=83451 RepID=UPI00193B0F9F|nr:AAA family ATPase [Archangium violaceum]QRK10518.1 AAA family ATPase [Archangium violaceum]
MSDLARVHIEELRLSGYRAFENARLQLDDLTVLVGRNGAGKSTLIDALEFVRDALSDSLANALERRGGVQALLHHGAREAKELAVVIRLRLSRQYLAAVLHRTELPAPQSILADDATVTYGFRIGPTRGGLGFEVKKEVAHAAYQHFTRAGRGDWRFGGVVMPHGVRATSRDALALPFAAEHAALWRALLDALKTSVRAYSLSPSAIRAEPPVSGASILNRSGGNAGDVLHHLERNKADAAWINKHLAAITPGIVRVRSETAAGRRLIRFHQRYNKSKTAGVVFDVGDMSDGTLRCLAILLALRQKPTPALVCIEEVEDSVHPAALGVLLDAIAASTSRCQVLLTSHSPEALSHPSVTPEQVRVVEWREGSSQLFKLSPGAEEMSRPPRSVGRLLRTNALFTAKDSERVEGDFFAAP